MKKQLFICIVAAIVLGMPYELLWGNGVFCMLLNMARALLILMFCLFVAIWIYSGIRKRADGQYTAEIAVITGVFVLSVIGKLFVLMTDVEDGLSFRLPENAWQSISDLYYSAYQALGGLTFEGLADYSMFDAWRTLLYSGSSLFAGMVAFTILTFRFSYEMYSRFVWSDFIKAGAKVYVFTAITEDSVILAHSIQERHRAKGRSLFKNRYKIVFLRTEDQDGFDAKKPLHQDIMRSGFLFMSYAPGVKNKSIPDFLKLRGKNDYYISNKRRWARGGEIHIFALDWEKDKTSENDKIIFEDIARITQKTFERRRLSELFGKNRRSNGIDSLPTDFVKRAEDYDRIIHYYYLLSEEIDIANVDMRFDKEINKFSRGGSRELRRSKTGYAAALGEIAGKELSKGVAKSKQKKDEDSKESKERDVYIRYKKHFVLTALNEANMAAFSYVKKRGELIKSYPEIYENDVNSKEYGAIVIGFGLNGQQTLKTAYIFAAGGNHGEDYQSSITTSIDQNGFVEESEENNADGWISSVRQSTCAKYRPQPFIADVYDKNASEIGGLFKTRHPMFRVNMPGESSEKFRYGEALFRINLHQESALSEEMIKLLDRIIDEGKGADAGARQTQPDVKSEKTKSLSKYNLILIALGDDDSNVNIANALLEDCKHEYAKSNAKAVDGRRTQVIAINLRNRLNYDRINWCEKDENEFRHLKVIIFGSAEEMYSYENIVDMSLAKRWNGGYSAISSKDNMSFITQQMQTAVEGKNDITLAELFRKFSADYDDERNEKVWYDMKDSMFYSRISSRYACEMPKYFAAYARAKGFCKGEEYGKIRLTDLIRLGAFEHDRWIRFMASYGNEPWDYGKASHFKLHSSIRKYDLISTQHYDMANAINAFAEEEKSKSSQG